MITSESCELAIHFARCRPVPEYDVPNAARHRRSIPGTDVGAHRRVAVGPLAGPRLDRQPSALTLRLRLRRIRLPLTDLGGPWTRHAHAPVPRVRRNLR